MREEQQQEKKYPAPVSAKFAGGALVAAIPMLAHFGPTGLLLSGVAGLIAYRHGPEMYDMARDTLPFLPSLEGRREPRTPGERTMWNRLLGIHPDQDGQAQEDEQEGDYWTYEGDEEPGPDTSLFTFSQLLASGFRPSLHKIFLGRLADGTDVNGKSSLLRLIMAQLCYIRVNVVLLNPHYMVYDRDHNEDWTPFTPYLARNPLDYVKVDNIAFMLKWIIEHTLVQRMEKARQGLSVGKPYFIVIDELPAIVAERKECAGYIAKLLREGRKYGIYLIVASQDFLVKTIGMDDTGGGVRKCFRTACYVGGDPTTARVLLEKQEKPIPETDLGKGKMMLRCAATRQAVLASVPYCDNDALYLLLGPSTFVKSGMESNMESLPSKMESVMESNEESNELAVKSEGQQPGQRLDSSFPFDLARFRQAQKLLAEGERNQNEIICEVWDVAENTRAFRTAKEEFRLMLAYLASLAGDDK